MREASAVATVEGDTSTTQTAAPDRDPVHDDAEAEAPPGSTSRTAGEPRAPSSTNERTWKRTRTAVAYVVLLSVLAAAGIAAIALARGTWAVNPVLTGSMRPGLSVGGVVISERVPVDQLAVRDVIVFQSPLDPSEQVVHRITAIAIGRAGQRLILTQGDANSTRDPWRLTIPGGSVDRVRWSLPLLGYVAVAYENHRGIVLIGAGMVLLALAVPMIARARRRPRASEDPPA